MAVLRAPAGLRRQNPLNLDGRTAPGEAHRVRERGEAGNRLVGKHGGVRELFRRCTSTFDNERLAECRERVEVRGGWHEWTSYFGDRVGPLASTPTIPSAVSRSNLGRGR